MPQWIQPHATDISGAERQYIDFLRKQNEDDSQRHRVVVQCFHPESKTWQEAFFFEPLHETVQTLMSEVLPIWEHAHRPHYCSCATHYASLQDMARRIETAESSFLMTKAAIDAFGKQPGVKPAAKQAVKALDGHVFYTEQDAANAVISVLRNVMADEDVRTLGNALIVNMQQGGVEPTAKRERLREMQASLAPYQAVNLQPAPTLEACPLCHLPRAFSFAALLIADTARLARILQLLDIDGIRTTHIPRVMQALELWLFTVPEQEDTYEKKMFPKGSMTGMILREIRAAIEAAKADLLSRSSFSSASTPTSSTGADLPPPPLPDSLPLDNSAILPN